MFEQKKDESICILWIFMRWKAMKKFNKCQKGNEYLKQAIHGSLRYVKGKFEKIFWISIWDVKDISNILCSYVCWKNDSVQNENIIFFHETFSKWFINGMLLAIQGCLFLNYMSLKAHIVESLPPDFLVWVLKSRAFVIKTSFWKNKDTTLEKN